MNDVIIYLVEVDEKKNGRGGIVKTPIKKQRFAKRLDVGMHETYEAQAHGLKPVITFELASYYDYGDETYIEYEGKMYKKIRSTQKGDSIRLVCEHLVNNMEVFGDGNAKKRNKG